jgi:hypothetical protein
MRVYLLTHSIRARGSPGRQEVARHAVHHCSWQGKHSFWFFFYRLPFDNGLAHKKNSYIFEISTKFSFHGYIKHEPSEKNKGVRPPFLGLFFAGFTLLLSGGGFILSQYKDLP